MIFLSQKFKVVRTLRPERANLPYIQTVHLLGPL